MILQQILYNILGVGNLYLSLCLCKFACTFGRGISLIGLGFVKLANSNAASAAAAAATACSAASWPNCTFRLRSFRFPNGTKRVQSILVGGKTNSGPEDA